MNGQAYRTRSAGSQHFLLTGPNVPAGVRLKAAITVLQSAGSLEPDDIGKTDAFAIDLDSMLGSGLLR